MVRSVPSTGDLHGMVTDRTVGSPMMRDRAARPDASARVLAEERVDRPRAESVTAVDPAPVSLEITDLHLFYGGFSALKGIDLTVARGEFVALLGPSGCGKTSLLRSIAGFVHPQRGTMRLNGRDVAELPPRRRNIGLVFQSYALFPHMTALENVCFGLECRNLPRGETAERAMQTLALVGLDGFADRRPKQLSGGQQQRVALARALVIEPDLLLLDEPLGALDKQLRVQMQTELKALQKRLGVTAIFVTHDQEEAMSMADRIVVIRDGAIEQIDSPELLFANPATAWICDFIGAGNLLCGDLIPAGPGRLRMDIGPGAVFEVDVPGRSDAGDVLFVPSNCVQLERVAAGEGLPIAARRYLGLSVELQIAYARGTIVTQLPVDQAAPFPVGCSVGVTARRADCRLLPDR